MNNCSPMTEPTAPSRARTADTPAITTTAITAIQPRPWISVPMSSPGAAPKRAAAPMRRTRCQYGPPLSSMTATSPPIAGSSASSFRPIANPAAIGAQTASTASVIAPQGTGAFLGRRTSAIHSGMTSCSQSGTACLALFTSRAPLKLRTGQG